MPSKSDEVGPWAKEKLQALLKYLNAYGTVMQRHTREIHGYHYVDAFAGLSRYRIKGTEEYIDGSARVALSAKHPFASYTFIDIDGQRAADLATLRQDFPDRDIRVYQGDANTILVETVVPAIPYNLRQRAIAFLDPYAMQLDYTTLKALGATGTIEVFVNIPTMAFNRDALRNNLLATPDAALKRMDRLWGSSDWRQVIYEAEGQVQQSLFGGQDIHYKLKPTEHRRLGELYRGRLHEAGFNWTSGVAVMCNATGQPIYCLVLAGPKEAGANIVNSIFKQPGVYLNRD